MFNTLQIARPFIASELDFHRERVTQDLAEAELRRRVKMARRERRQRRALNHGQRRNAPRTA